MGLKSGHSGMNGDWKVRKHRWWRSLAYSKKLFHCNWKENTKRKRIEVWGRSLTTIFKKGDIWTYLNAHRKEEKYEKQTKDRMMVEEESWENVGGD